MRGAFQQLQPQLQPKGEGSQEATLPFEADLPSISLPFLSPRVLAHSSGIHPTLIAESFQRASTKAVEYLTEMSTPVDLNDRETLMRAASTSLNSKVSSHASLHLERFALTCLTRAILHASRSSPNTPPSSLPSPSLPFSDLLPLLPPTLTFVISGWSRRSEELSTTPSLWTDSLLPRTSRLEPEDLRGWRRPRSRSFSSSSPRPSLT